MKRVNRDKILNAIADYKYSEGCSCCRDSEKHTEAENRMAKLLGVEPYPDGSGFDFAKYRTGYKP